MANVDPVRIGYISTIDYKNGTATVVYKECEDSVSPELPFLSDEYDMPDIDDQVIVVTPQDTTRGLILGKVYHDGNRPVEGRKGIWRKDFKGGGYLQYDFASRRFTVGGSLTVTGDLHVGGNLTVSGSYPG
ncbi:hypothetical protein NXH76_12095 [Blautia schinkii]|nr:hypothetical protein [Blautia schinkii]